MKPYYRLFLALTTNKENNTDEKKETTGSKPFGSLLLEKKDNEGKASIHAQGITPFQKYTLYLIGGASDKKQLAVSLGQFYADQNGHCDTKFTFNPQNVSHSKLCIDSFYGAAVALSNHVSSFALSGESSQQPLPWHNLHFYEPKTDANNDTDTDVEGLVEKFVRTLLPFPEKTEPLRLLEKPKHLRLLKIKKDNKEEEKEDIHHRFFTFIKQMTPEPHHKEQIKPNKTQETTHLKEKCCLDQQKELACVFQTHTAMSPFQKQNKPFVWVRISPEELSLLPIKNIYWANHPLLTSCYESHKHLILGKMEDNQTTHYAVGLPDVYYPHAHETARHLGFMQFKPCEGKEVKEGVYGYWLQVF